MTIVAALAALLILGPLIAISIRRRYGVAALAITVVLVGAALFPRNLITLIASGEAVPYDIAPSSLAIQTQTAAFLLAGVIILIGRRKLRLPPALIVFVVLLSAGMVITWDPTTPMWSGYAVLMIAVLAFAVGRAVGSEVVTQQTAARFFLTVIIVILVLQLMVAVLQLAGVPLPTGLVNSDRTLEQTVGRVSGTIGHPANLSKVTFILTLLALPFTAAADGRLRRLAFTAVVLAVILGGLTVSRANLIAVFVLLALWILTFPGRARVGTRLTGAIGLAAAAAAFAPLVLERFEDDSEGGLRPLLLDAAMRQLQSDVWIGTGPNAYIATVGQFDAATASGYPVHNSFLLLTAELGWVLALMFFLPLFGLILGSLRRLGRSHEFLHVPRLVVYATPGIAVILLTGWGMTSVLAVGLWMCALGILRSALDGGTLPALGPSEMIVGQQTPTELARF